MQHLINLEDNAKSNVIRSTSDSVNSWFERPKLTKLDTPCQFLQKNNLKHYRMKVLKNGLILLSVYDRAGKHYYAKQRNFKLAYISLVRKFYDNINKN